MERPHLLRRQLRRAPLGQVLGFGGQRQLVQLDAAGPVHEARVGEVSGKCLDMLRPICLGLSELSGNQI